jgi:hypothetical protein
VDEEAIGDMLLDLDEPDSGPPAGSWKNSEVSVPEASPDSDSTAQNVKTAGTRKTSATDVASKMLQGSDIGWIKRK